MAVPAVSGAIFAAAGDVDVVVAAAFVALSGPRASLLVGPAS